MFVYPSGLLAVHSQKYKCKHIYEYKSASRIIDFILGAVCFRTLFEFLSNFKSHLKSSTVIILNLEMKNLEDKRVSFPKAKCQEVAKPESEMRESDSKSTVRQVLLMTCIKILGNISKYIHPFNGCIVIVSHQMIQ